MTTAPPNRSLFFLHNADGLYTAARFAFFARLTTPMFRLSHHAVEYYLKSLLVDHYTLTELKGFGHGLSCLYNEYKKVTSATTDHSPLVEYISNFEELRYPGDTKFRMRAWDKPFAELFQEFPTAKERKAILWFDLAGFDQLIASIRDSIGPRQQFPFFIATEDQAEYLYRDNAQYSR